MVTRENVAKQQCHLDLRDGGHAGAHDLHLSTCGGLGEVLPQYA